MSYTPDRVRGLRQVSVRFPLTDYERIRTLARENGRSLSMECARHVLAGMQAQEQRRERTPEREAAATQ
jgi:hypothetical protein